ncbi:hypothetical protein [Geofilum rubicundum]|uniref:hypothetical protein n=1 Tax=Geofilum rubicundum TaxID=472113 RepID=UPI0007843740|nr:hypothetical protein [Geofilum rubicundum]
MKKKLFFAIATGFFAVATMFNINMVHTNRTSDVSLESIAVMARANGGETRKITCSFPWNDICFSGQTSEGYVTWDGTKTSDTYE